MATVEFFREHGRVILIGLGGVILGVILNGVLRDRKNKKYLSLLIKEYNQLKDKSNISSLSQEEQKQMDKLDSEIFIMKFKCIA